MVKELLRARVIAGRAVRFHRYINTRCSAPRRRGIQYAAASAFKHSRLGVLDRPVEPGDDSECVVIANTMWQPSSLK
ncbi:hypothetical protein [Bradyrhizobium sp.]|uniref:hypothetical protein n=1 Tax=Bradyrhizobium sp. TaxID=376 RepID=UPI000A03A634|nr:hypothetical protein [Bradyrhizobium sp.]